MYLENIPPKYLPKNVPIEEVPCLGPQTIEETRRGRIGKFLKAFEDSGKVKDACRVAGISYYQYLRWTSYPEFQWLLDMVNGYRKIAVEDKSFEVAIEDKRATLERIFLLKKLDPSYRDRQSSNQAGLSIHIDNVSVGKASLLQGSIDATTTDSTT